MAQPTNKHLSVEIIIRAPKEKVWAILTDFDNYHTWNPFIISSAGKAVVGTRLRNVMRNGGKDFTFKPKLLAVQENVHFEWLGNLLIPGIFDGRHYFRIEDIGNGQVKLTQGEHFSGILSGMLLKSMGEDTRRNFIAMNEALRQRAEAE